jgi:uncharacterized protein (UPF0332 family)
MFPCAGYLELAKKLAAIDDEASMRSAVSRAYYAAFHKAKLFAKNDGSGTRFSGGVDIHKEVVDFLKEHTNQSIQSLSSKLDRLRKDRNACDYGSSMKNVKSIAGNSIILAEKIFDNTN